MTEQEKINELMKPRYIVIADYPNSPFEVGEILAQDLNTVGEIFVNIHHVDHSRHDRNWIGPDKIDKFPNLFRKLEWWQEREESELPKYVRDKVSGIALKIEYNFKGQKPSDVWTWNNQSKRFWNSLYDLIPITEAEYNAYATALAQINPFE